MANIRALVIEDNKGWIRTITRTLESCGCEVTVASSHKQAKEELARQAYDMITLDMMLADDTNSSDTTLRQEITNVAASGGWDLLVMQLAARFPEVFIFVVSGSFKGQPPSLAFDLSHAYGVKGFMDKDSYDATRILAWVDLVRQYKAKRNAVLAPKQRIRLTESEHEWLLAALGPDVMRSYDIELLPEPIQVTLRFESISGGAKIIWEGAEIGVAHSVLQLPYDSQSLQVVIKALDAIQYPNHPISGPSFTSYEQQLLTQLNLWEGNRVPREAYRRVGSNLYKALIADRAADVALNSVRVTARRLRKAIYYVLRFPYNAVELASLPWEALHREQQALLLGLGGEEIDSCVRYLDIAEPISPPLPAGKKLHILALAPHVGIDSSLRERDRSVRIQCWQPLKACGLLDWDELSPVNISTLDKRMRHGPRPDIIHYYGHGMYKDGQGYLCFDHPMIPGESELVDTARLATRLGGIRLIVLYACQSAMANASESQGGLLTGIGPALSTVSEAVVAMQMTVRSEAALLFSEVFYTELVRGRSLQSAFADARRSLFLNDRDGTSWYVPTLHIRSLEQRPVYFVSIRDFL